MQTDTPHSLRSLSLGSGHLHSSIFLLAPVSQLLLMTSGLHFSTYPVSTTSEVQAICEAQVTGEVGVCALTAKPPRQLLTRLSAGMLALSAAAGATACASARMP